MDLCQIMNKQQGVDDGKKHKQKIHAVTTNFENGFLRNLIHGIVSKLSRYFTKPISANQPSDRQGQVGAVF